MDAETFVSVSRLLIIIGWVITFVTWLGYTAIAPWYKYSAGRYIWGLLFTILGILGSSLLRFFFPGFPYREEAIILALVMFDLALLGMGIGIYKAQIFRYHKAKTLEKQQNSQ